MARQLGAGDEFGNYRIEGLAGRGGMGLVYRARQKRPDRTVAIKVIAPELAADPDFRARFEDESATAAQIEHPNVIPVYEVGDEDGLLYIAMRYVDGIDLGRLLADSGPLPPQRAAHLVSQASAALDAAHARGLVHRDIKPGNILVARGDNVYLTDFGLTKRITDTRGLTKTGMFVGTVDYIAPEQFEGRRVDARADVYALGCVLYELLAGTVPFPRDSELAKLYAHVHDVPPPLTGVPARLAAAVARAMSKRPEDRFQSAGDFGRAVLGGAEPAPARGEIASTKAELLSPTEVEAPQPAKLSPTKGTPLGSRRLWPAALVALMVVIGAGVAIAIGSGGPAPAISTTSTTTTSSSPLTTRTQPANRAILAPATVPPSVDECQRQLMFAVDGTAGPVKCANGDVNVVAWTYYARDGHARLLSLGPFATPQQALQAMCKDASSTIPLEDEAYQLARTYYGWRFAVDPSTAYPSSCP